MTPIHADVERALGDILAALGLGDLPARLAPVPDPSLGDAAVTAALPAARILKRPPASIAADIAGLLAAAPGLSGLDVVGPGYVNVRFSDAAVAAAIAEQAADPRLGIRAVSRPERIVIDFGGPNVKPMHVGHLRSFVLGESLRRILAALGHDVVSDIHLGDWGLPAGMILSEVRKRVPDASWFAAGATGPFPDIVPIAAGELHDLYPTAAAACAADPARMEEARALTAALQRGEPGPGALWAGIVALAKEGIRASSDRIGAHFDLWLGESDAQPHVPAVLAAVEAAGAARGDGQATLIDLAEPGDRHEVPPLVLRKGDGAVPYATTDLATLLSRVRDLGAERVLYVVDARQWLHFEQVFRAARKAGIAPACGLEHVGFGTVNGADGKPYRTRSGGVMRLDDLLDLARDKAAAIADGGPGAGEAEAIGLAALRIADLSAHRTTGYVLDVDRALAFEGRTGPYLLYAAVRLRALLAKGGPADAAPSIASPAERRLALACLGFGASVARAAEARSPHELVAYAFGLAGEVSRFYVECPVLSEPDADLRSARLALCALAERVLSRCLHLLGCRVPAAM